MRRKREPLQKKRRTAGKGVFKILHSKTRRKKKQRVAAGASAGDLGSEVPNLGVARALFVILLLHVAAVAAIFIHNRVTNDDPVVKKTTVSPAGATTGGGGGTSAVMAAGLPQVEQGEDYYFVATGDTYERIADVKGVDLGALRDLNNNVALRAGRILRLPTPGAGGSSSAVVVRASIPASVPPPRRETPRSVAEPPTVAVVSDARPEPVVARAQLVEENPPSEAVRVRPNVAHPPVATPKETPVAASSDSGRRYTVKSGDTVWSIANRHKVSTKTLLSSNGITDPRKLRVGATLKIPAK